MRAGGGRGGRGRRERVGEGEGGGRGEGGGSGEEDRREGNHFQRMPRCRNRIEANRAGCVGLGPDRSARFRVCLLVPGLCAG